MHAFPHAMQHKLPSVIDERKTKSQPWYASTTLNAAKTTRCIRSNACSAAPQRWNAHLQFLHVHASPCIQNSMLCSTTSHRRGIAGCQPWIARLRGKRFFLHRLTDVLQTVCYKPNACSRPPREPRDTDLHLHLNIIFISPKAATNLQKPIVLAGAHLLCSVAPLDSNVTLLKQIRAQWQLITYHSNVCMIKVQQHVIARACIPLS